MTAVVGLRALAHHAPLGAPDHIPVEPLGDSHQAGTVVGLPERRLTGAAPLAGPDPG